MADYKSGRLASDITRIISGMLPRLKDPRIKDRLLTVVREEHAKILDRLQLVS